MAERVIQVANENAAEVTQEVASELAGGGPRLEIAVDTFKYDASVFALGALGTTIFLFVNTLAGGLLALSAPIAALLLKGRVSQEIKAEGKRRGPEAARKIAATLGPKLDELVDGFASRLGEFIAEAGAAMARGIAEVLAGALIERKQRAATNEASVEGQAAGALLQHLKRVDEAIAEVRQKVWDAS